MPASFATAAAMVSSSHQDAQVHKDQMLLNTKRKRSVKLNRAVEKGMRV
jgi:hypothetical protein